MYSIKVERKYAKVLKDAMLMTARKKGYKVEVAVETIEEDNVYELEKNKEMLIFSTRTLDSDFFEFSLNGKKELVLELIIRANAEILTEIISQLMAPMIKDSKEEIKKKVLEELTKAVEK